MPFELEQEPLAELLVLIEMPVLADFPLLHLNRPHWYLLHLYDEGWGVELGVQVVPGQGLD